MFLDVHYSHLKATGQERYSLSSFQARRFSKSPGDRSIVKFENKKSLGSKPCSALSAVKIWCTLTFQPSASLALPRSYLETWVSGKREKEGDHFPSCPFCTAVPQYVPAQTTTFFSYYSSCILPQLFGIFVISMVIS